MSYSAERPQAPALALVGVATAAAAAAVATLRAAGVVSRSVGLLAAAAGALAAVASLAGWYSAAALSRRGRKPAKAGVALGALAVLVAIVGGGIQDGTFRPARFGAAFLNAGEIRQAAPVLLGGAWNTLRLAFTAEVLSLTLAVILASLRISGSRLGRATAAAYVDVMRGIPIVVLATLFYGGLPFLGITMSPFTAAVVVLGLNSSAYAAEIFRAGIQSVTRGQMEAARSLGMPYAQAMSNVVLPQAGRNVVPPLMSDFIALLKDTAIVLAVTGFTADSADIYGRARTFAASTFSPTALLLAALYYIAILVPLIRLVGYLERRARQGYA